MAGWFSIAFYFGIAGCCTQAAWNSTEDWIKFLRFSKDFSKVYHSDEELSERFAAFRASLQRHALLNRDYPPGSPVYGVNKFSDLTPAEFKERYLSPLVTDDRPPLHATLPTSPKDAPMAFDWRQKGKVTPVKNQGRCGSCWAFSVVETVESRAAILGYPLTSLSTQQLLSCDNDSQFGCEGGLPSYAFSWLKKGAEPLTTEQQYPFESSDGHTYPCRERPVHGILVESYHFKEKADEEDMLSNLSSISPLSVGVNAVSWQDYIGGVIQHHCSAVGLDHAVVIVGYNLTGEVPYWIVRNTWGTDWGVDGYVLLKYGVNICGVAQRVSFPDSVSKV